MTQLPNKRLFRTPEELLKYRELHVNKLNQLATLEQTPQTIKQMERIEEYISWVDVLLHDSFYSTIEESLTNGNMLKIDKVLFPNMDPEKFITAASMITIGQPSQNPPLLGAANTETDSTQLKIEFKDKKGVTQKQTKSLSLDELIQVTFTSTKNPNLTTLIQAAKIYGSKSNLKFEENIKPILDEMLEKYDFIRKYDFVKNAGKWMLDVITGTKTIVKPFLLLKKTSKEEDPIVIGELLEWLIERGFQYHAREGKYKNLNLPEIRILASTPYRISMENDPFNNEKSKEIGNGLFLMCNEELCNELIKNPSHIREAIRYVENLTNPSSKKLFCHEDGTVSERGIVRIIREAIDYGSPLKRTSIAERRQLKLQGILPSKEYVEKGY